MPLDLTPQKPPYYTIDQTGPLGPSAIIGNSYIARISQSGTANPTALTNINNTITGLTYTRTGVGAYTITAPDDTFTLNKTWILLGPTNSPFSAAYVRCYYNSDIQLTLETYVGGEIATDNILVDMTILIIVTP